jgi:hypothetical protein
MNSTKLKGGLHPSLELASQFLLSKINYLNYLILNDISLGL